MSKILLLFVSILIGVGVSYAQTGSLFTVDKELSSSMINDVYQDRRGVLWIATENGLNRYDGAKFTHFKHDKEKSNSLLNNFVRTVEEDTKGNLLVGTLCGLQLYEVSVDTFQKIPLMLLDGDTFDAYVTSIYKQSNGEVLIGTSGHGVFKLREGKNGLYCAYQDSLLSSCGYMVNTVLVDEGEGCTWIGFNNKGICRVARDGKTRSYMGNRIVSCMCRDEKGVLYVGTVDDGLFKYDVSGDRFVQLIGKIPVTSLYADGEKRILIGTDGIGLKIYDIEKSCISDEEFYVSFYDFSRSKIHSIVRDRDGGLWFGLFQKGVLYVPNTPNKFHYIGYKSMQNPIGSCCVVSVCRDREGLLWVGTDSDGVYAINRGGKRVYHYDHTNSNVPMVTMSIYEDTRGSLWLGAYMDGLCKLNKKTGRCEYIVLKDSLNNPVKNIYSITEDTVHQMLWIGTMGSGLYGLDLRTGRQECYYHNTSNYSHKINVLMNDWIPSLYLSKEGRLYIGTYFGLACMDVEGRDFVSVYGDNRLFENLVVFASYEDVKGNIWVGTSDGLICIEAGTHRYVFYSMKDGLPSNIICAITEDSSNRLWFSTNYGISCFDPERNTFTNYYANDGLYGNEYSKGAVWKDRDGYICFGGVNGIVYFNPEGITVPEKKLNIYVAELYVRDQSVHKGMRSDSRMIVDTTVMDAREFHLSHEDNSFSIEFSSMEFVNPERIVFMYSVNGEDWISLQSGVNRLSFSKLAPGDYQFKVKAKDFEVYSPEMEFVIHIYPPLYLTIWAKVLYVLLLFGIGYLVYVQIRHRYKVRQQILEQTHARDINEAKLQFFINVSHEIRTPISLIISPLQKLMSMDKDEVRYKLYKLISRNTDRILNLVNQLIDVRKIDKGQMVLKYRETDMVNLLRNLMAAFRYQAQEKRITFSLHTDKEVLNVWVDANHFDKIILNLFSNAFKFTPEGGVIDVYLREGEAADMPNYYEIVVSDDGEKIEEDKIERIFERFYQIDNSQNSLNMGSGVGLHLTRSLVMMHHGRIWAENNNDGKGCRFVVRLPMGNSHLKREEMVLEPKESVEKEGGESFFGEESMPEQDMKSSVRKRVKYKVLLVEDDDEIRKYLREELGEYYYISECKDGKEALAYILQHEVNLVISDVMMPEMDGMTLCRKIKQNININHIPVVLLTAKIREEDNIEGLEMGADAYIMKPFSIEIVKRTVENIIRGRETLKASFSGSQIQEEKLDKVVLKSPDEKLLDRVMEVINKNLGDSDFNVETLSQEVGISRVHLHRKLKELTNQTTKDLIKNIRLKQAADLIAEGKHHSISEVAMTVGYSNFTNFSTVFKEFYGVSPTEYRRMNQKDTEEN